MPGMHGTETARRLRESNPDVVMVLISIGGVPPSAASSPGVTTHVRKQSLSPRTLERICFEDVHTALWLGRRVSRLWTGHPPWR
jgi:hypothetical protein